MSFSTASTGFALLFSISTIAAVSNAAAPIVSFCGCAFDVTWEIAIGSSYKQLDTGCPTVTVYRQAPRQPNFVRPLYSPQTAVLPAHQHGHQHAAAQPGYGKWLETLSLLGLCRELTGFEHWLAGSTRRMVGIGGRLTTTAAAAAACAAFSCACCSDSRAFA